MSFLDAAAQFWSDWGLRIYVLSSLSANVLLSLLSGTRRRSAAGWRAVLLWFVARLLWLAYQVAEIAGTGALGNMSLSGSGASSPEEQQVIAFWAPFLLLHLGGPDTMTAYALEDNALSLRKLAEIVFHVLGAAYALYRYVYLYRTRSSALLAASALVFVAGIVRYLEKWYALRRSSNLGNIMDDNDYGGGCDGSDEEPDQAERSLLSSSEPAADQNVAAAAAGSSGSSATTTTTTARRRRGLELGLGQVELGNEKALRLAQDLFHVCRRAMSDSSVVPDPERQRASDEIFRLGWRSMCTVVEMELCLVYEALYTKSVVLHTSPVVAYLVRLLSPLTTAAAAVLFNRYYYYYAGTTGMMIAGGGSRRSRTTIRGPFAVITYLLLGCALALDVVWLLRALVSTWTYAALKAQRRRQAPAWWRRLHRAIVALEECSPVSWLLSFCGSDDGRERRRSHHRTWSGTIGRYNLLDECCAAHRRRGCRWFWSWLKKKCELEESLYMSHLPQEVKGLLMERVRRILASTTRSERFVDESGRACYYYTMEVIRTKWGHRAFLGAKKLMSKGNDGVWRDELPLFGREFEEDVLAWHIATCVFLSGDKVKEIMANDATGPPLLNTRAHSHLEIPQQSTEPAGPSTKIKAIEAMSEYLMFLVAVRRQMLPGLIQHNLFEATFQALGEIWAEAEKAGNETSSASSSSSSSSPKDKLAHKLRQLKKSSDKQEWFVRDSGTRRVKYASVLAGILVNRSRKQEQVPQLLDFIFNVWVDKLLYAAVRCSRESHAKQLSRGGDLTTVLWMVFQHATLFRMGEMKPDYKEPDDDE